MAEGGIKHGGKYCVAGGPNKASCKNTSYTPGISMHVFPKDESVRRMWTRFIRRHRADFVPTQFSAVCSAHFAPSCFERKLSLGDETDDNPPHRKNLKRGSVPTVDAVVRSIDMDPSAIERDERGERRRRKQVTG